MNRNLASRLIKIAMQQGQMKLQSALVNEYMDSLLMTSMNTKICTLPKYIVAAVFYSQLRQHMCQYVKQNNIASKIVQYANEAIMSNNDSINHELLICRLANKPQTLDGLLDLYYNKTSVTWWTPHCFLSSCFFWFKTQEGGLFWRNITEEYQKQFSLLTFKDLLEMIQIQKK